MSFYEDIRQSVSEVLGEFEQGDVSLISVTSGTGTLDDPGTPTETITTLDAAVRGVSYAFVQNGLAVNTDLEVIASVIEGVTVGEKDYLTIDGERFKIVRYMPVPAAGTVVAWKFIVRRGG